MLPWILLDTSCYPGFCWIFHAALDFAGYFMLPCTLYLDCFYHLLLFDWMKSLSPIDRNVKQTCHFFLNQTCIRQPSSLVNALRNKLNWIDKVPQTYYCHFFSVAFCTLDFWWRFNCKKILGRYFDWIASQNKLLNRIINQSINQSRPCGFSRCWTDAIGIANWSRDKRYPNRWESSITNPHVNNEALIPAVSDYHHGVTSPKESHVHLEGDVRVSDVISRL